jgi:hypothetical protein
MEFDYALEAKKPIIGFIHANRGLIPRDRSEIDPARTEKLDDFISKVRLRPVRRFASPQELALEVTTSFVDLKARKPAVGFVRADQTVDFKKYSELLEENRDLKKRLQELSAVSSQELAEWFAEETTLEVLYGSHPKGVEKIAASWRDIALLLAPLVAACDDEDDMFRELAFALFNRNKKDKLRKYSCKLADECKSRVRMKFVMTGLVIVSNEQRTTTEGFSNQYRPYNASVWKFTELGRTQISILFDRSSSDLRKGNVTLEDYIKG